MGASVVPASSPPGPRPIHPNMIQMIRHVTRRRSIAIVFVIASLLITGDVLAEDSDGVVDFSKQIRPILAGHCWTCHGPDEKSRTADLRLDVRENAIAASAIVPNDPSASKLVERILSDDPESQMPPPSSKKSLSDAQKNLLQKWIQQGAGYSKHWAFIAPAIPPLPTMHGSSWGSNAIDHFVGKRLEQENLKPSPKADGSTLLRRASLDLTGLPPTVDDLKKFLSDPSNDAYEHAVDRLLGSKGFAEKMAMEWLDLARYADTNGYNNDEDRTMWPWRDWVIDAFDRNMPFDKFTIEQLAGDLLPNPTQDQLIATAFLRNQGHNTEGGIIQEEYRVEYVADRVHTVSTVFLGLSMQCARCHDHKFDPITQAEYYQFYSFFNSLDEKQASYSKFVGAEPFIRVPTAEQESKIAVLAEQIASLESQMKQLGDQIDTEKPTIETKLSEAKKEKLAIEGSIAAVMVMREMNPARETFILKRGQYDQPSERVDASVPTILLQTGTETPKDRLKFAQWLVSDTNPLTARVTVNRWWQNFFGTGIVKTTEDFGLTGDAPSNSELLDFLARSFVESGWNVKAMHKMIVMSATYQQASRIQPEMLDRDPDNRLLARGPRYRLSAETIRDNALAISGLLQHRVGGPSVKPYQPAGLWEDVTVNRQGKYVSDVGEGLYRRSLYTFWKRTCPPPSMMSFDAPIREVCVARRARTNTPLQSLVLLNDPTYVECARLLAQNMIRDGGTSVSGRIDTGFQRSVSRPASPEEQNILGQVLEAAKHRFNANPSNAQDFNATGATAPDASIDPAELASWTIVASTLLNLDETISKR